MKYVIVTGAYGGMGRATTLALVKAGYTVFALDKTVKEREDGIIPVAVDVTDENSVLAAKEAVLSVTDEIYAIVHFVGIYVLDSLAEISDEKMRKVFDVNFFGAYSVNKAFIGNMSRGGKIIITTSELAPLDPLPFTGLYAVTKAALDKYAYSLKMELQLIDIDVSVIRAGAVSTGMLNVSLTALDEFCNDTALYKCNAEKFKKIVNSVESKAVPPEKIANLAAKILKTKRPRFAYSINRNFLLLLLNALPKRLQLFAIRKILKTNDGE